jgi:ABC-type transport system substrate-binding protein
MFMLTAFKPKQRIVLEVNPNRYPSYFPTEGTAEDRTSGALRDAGARLPLVDKVVFSVVKESVTAFNLFQQGYLDVSGVTNTNATQVLKGADLSPDMKRRGVTMRRDVSLSVRYCFFNMNDPDWGGYTEKRRKMRQAVSLSIDSQAYIDVFNRGNGVLAQSMLPPGVFGYDPNFRNPYLQFEPSLAKAKRLLAEAGYPNGIDPKTNSPLTLTMDGQSGSPESTAQFEQTKRSVEKLGIKVNLVLTRYSVWQDKTNKGQFQFAPIYGWFADYPDPENFLFLLYSQNKAPGPNASFYNNPEYDRLFLQMQKMEDSPERLALIQKMLPLVTEDCPVIPIYHDVNYSLSQDWVRNTKTHPISNDDSQYRAIDPELRAQKQAAWNRPNFNPLWWGLAAVVAGTVPAVRVIGQRTNRKVRRRGAVTGSEGEQD